MTTKSSRTILEMTNEEAADFLTKKESYFTLNLPEYFDLRELLTNSRDMRGELSIESTVKRMSDNLTFLENYKESPNEIIKRAEIN